MNNAKKFLCAVKALLFHQGRFLLTRKAGAPPGAPLPWDLPAGWIEFGETPVAALHRTIEAGTGLRLREIQPLSAWSQTRDPETQIVGLTYLCVAPSGKLQLAPEYAESAWIKAEEIFRYSVESALRQDLRQWDWKEIEEKVKRHSVTLEGLRPGEADRPGNTLKKAKPVSAAPAPRKAPAPDHAGAKPAHAFKVGGWVDIEGMAGVGRILDLDERRRQARIMVNDQEWVLALMKLTPTKPPKITASPGMIRVSGSPPVAHEIDLHGMRVEDAMEMVDRALDQAMVNHLSQLKIIHGHGTGAVRNAIRQMLNRHPHVTHYRFGGPTEGGLACTIAEIRLRG